VSGTETATLAALVHRAGQGSRVVWLDQIAYAARLFSAGKDVWSDAGGYIAVARQSQGLLRSDVLEWRLGDAQRAAVAADPALARSWQGRRPSIALRQIMADASLIERSTAVLKALDSLFPNVPRVLVVEGLESQLVWLSSLTTEGGLTTVEADDVDEGSVYLADAIRKLSTVGLSGLVLDVRGPGNLLIDDVAELHRPVLNVARHYGWSLGFLVDSQRLPDATGTSADLDLVLCPEGKPSEVGSPGSVPVGGGLTPAFWRDEHPPAPGPGLLFGTVAADATPERVLARLKSLRATSEQTPLKGS
jgi:hypothetical protein